MSTIVTTPLALGDVMTLAIRNNRTQDVAVSIIVDGRQLDLINREGITVKEVICKPQTHEDVLLTEWIDDPVAHVKARAVVKKKEGGGRYRIFHKFNGSIIVLDLATIPPDDPKQRGAAELRTTTWKSLRHYDTDVLPEEADILQWDAKRRQWMLNLARAS